MDEDQKNFLLHFGTESQTLKSQIAELRKDIAALDNLIRNLLSRIRKLEGPAGP